MLTKNNTSKTYNGIMPGLIEDKLTKTKLDLDPYYTSYWNQKKTLFFDDRFAPLCLPEPLLCRHLWPVCMAQKDS